MIEQKKLLIIGLVWPEPNSSAAGKRMMQLIAFFKKQKYQITFACTAIPSPFMANLKNYNIEIQEIKLNNSNFDLFIKTLNPNVVLFDRFMSEEQFGWRISENCPNALRILDTEDLHCLRKAREKAFAEKRIFEIDDLLTETIAQREIASILRCDLSLIIAKFEIEILQSIFKIDAKLLLYLPFLLPPITKTETEKWIHFESRKDFVFIGNFLHNPNWDAVLNLKKNIWPIIKKQLPETNLFIYGAYPTPKNEQLHDSKNGFYIMGRAKNAFEVISKSRVLLAPLRFGAGLKGKLIEAMECGTPSVTTSIGAESISDSKNWPGFVNNNINEFANCAVNLYSTKELWQKAQQKGIEIYNTQFDKIIFETVFEKKLTSLIANIKLHRKHNFYGNLLQHQTLCSTKYMSKWIEAKNKNEKLNPF